MNDFNIRVFAILFFREVVPLRRDAIARVRKRPPFRVDGRLPPFLIGAESDLRAHLVRTRSVASLRSGRVVFLRDVLLPDERRGALLVRRRHHLSSQR